MDELPEPRLYYDLEDLRQIHQLLQRGRQAANGSYYLHTGDINWWMFYPPLNKDLWQHLFVWDDPQDTGRLLGFALATPDDFNVYPQPELVGTAAGLAMIGWGEAHTARLARQAGTASISCIWIIDSDVIQARYLNDRGFERNPRSVYPLVRIEIVSISPTPALPAGYRFSTVDDPASTKERARAQYHAFSNTKPWEAYLERFARFRQAPIYDPELDVCVIAPDGRVAAFCIVWTDPLNHVGLFEPVGTHPDFQRQGFGRAVLQEALRRLGQRDMRQAIVCTEHDNIAALRLYQSIGFRKQAELASYMKTL